MSNTPSLLPCPFCGGDARHDAHADDCYFILHRKFKNSGADMSPAFEVLAAWNRRVAPAAMIGEPVFAFRRKGLDDFCTCTEERYAELSAKPNLFETRIFYTTPPIHAAGNVLEDAARYRWLRQHWFTMLSNYQRGITFKLGGPRWSDITEAELDAAIDAARKQGTKP